MYVYVYANVYTLYMYIYMYTNFFGTLHSCQQNLVIQQGPPRSKCIEYDSKNNETWRYLYRVVNNFMLMTCVMDVQLNIKK